MRAIYRAFRRWICRHRWLPLVSAGFTTMWQCAKCRSAKLTHGGHLHEVPCTTIEGLRMLCTDYRVWNNESARELGYLP